MARPALGDAPRADAAWAESAPEIDGRLDDGAWASAARHGGFSERKPRLRATPTDETRFAILYDGAALYVGLWCDDEQPGEIRALTRTRDTFTIFRDDAISLKIDAALDRRTTQGFALNPAGARLDYRAIEGANFKIEYDAVWDGAAVRTRGGWTAEFRIPWAALGVDPSAPPEAIGLNISRDHPRRNATYDWSLMPPPNSPISASLYGTIAGFDQLASRGSTTARGATDRPWSMVPFVLGGFRVDSDEDPSELFGVGLDVSAELPGRWRAQLTVNTDFAQVDLDDSVVNLTQFGLFQPEKRDFFLTDFEVFEAGRPETAQPLYTRRIGLRNGEEVPVLAGVKLVGRPADALRIGVLAVTTRPTRTQPWTSSLVGRGLADLGGGSNAGLQVTHRQSHERTDDRNTMFAGNGTYRGPPSFPLLVRANAMVSVTGPDAPDPESGTGGTVDPETDALQPAPGMDLAVEWRDELVRPGLAWAWYADGLRSDLGFLRRVGIHEGAAGVTVEPRIGEAGVEKVTLFTWGSTVMSEAFDVLDYQGGGSLGLQFDVGYNVSASGAWKSETVLADFEISEETVVEAGEYDGPVATLSFSTPGQYVVSGSVGGEYRSFFGGVLAGGNATISAQPSALVRIDVSGRYSHVRFDDGREGFDSAIVNGRVALGFTRDLSLSLFGGYSHLDDQLQVQSRLRFAYLPGSDLFLVYQLDLDADAWKTSFQSLVLKATVRY